MKEFKNKVAVVTGASSGIGYAIAKRCAKEGMNLVLASRDIERLLLIQEEIMSFGVKAVAVETNVAKLEDIERLADVAYTEFGAVHLLCNNAGVLHVAPILEHTIKDWEWVLGVNLFGVINSINVFGPLMQNQNIECHIVNTSSIAAFTSGPGLAAYKVSKHAILALSEILYAEMQDTKVSVSILCPGWVDTNIMNSDKHRPTELKNREDFQPLGAEANRQKGINSAKKGVPPSKIADLLIEGIRRKDFYIITDYSFSNKLLERVDGILK
jgi:short-subunit dehydrogenase